MRARLPILCGAVFGLSAVFAGGAYVVLLPHVIMTKVQVKLTGPCAMPGIACGPFGVFLHKRKLSTADDRIVVNPNTDTLYSSAWIDLAKGPYLLHVPPSKGRYYSFELLDMWTNVFGDISRRVSGGEGGDYVIAGPSWSGQMPEGEKLFRASTDHVWVLARTGVDGEADIPAANAFQDGFKLTQLAR